MRLKITVHPVDSEPRTFERIIIGNSVLELPRHIGLLTRALHPHEWFTIEITVNHDRKPK